MFSDDCCWDTPKSIKALNESIFKLPAKKHTSKRKKRLHIDLHAKKQSDVYIAGDTMVNDTVKAFTSKVQNYSVTAQAVMSHDCCKSFENKVSEKCCSLEHVKKKKHKKKQSQTATADDGGTCHAINQDHSSSSKVLKPDVKVKSAAKCVRNAKRSMKSECSNSISNFLSVVPNEVCKLSSLDSSVLSKRKKRKRRCSEADATTELKKSRAVDSRSDEIHVVAGKCSSGGVQRNFNVDQLRSALQHNGRLSDAVLQQDRLFDKNRTVQINQESASASTKCKKGDINVLEVNSNSLHSDIVTASSSSGLLKERMKNRLTSARFRFVNEQMYNSTGVEAAKMFAHDKDAFSIYHAGFQSQVSKWPMNPVDKMIDYINISGSYAVVADFGCGEAKIAKSVPNVVHSFDLVALNEHVTACDMANVPLEKASVDIAIFCLSLMDTNIVQYLAEASRVLKLGGILLIAEVISRFKKIGSFVRKLRKLGFGLENKVVNKMFVWFEMKKVCGLPADDCMPSIELYPCVYKKR